MHQVEGVVATEAACQAACASTASCNSYTWTPGPEAGKKDCRYTHQCWWRDDTVWALKASNNCAGRSGFKGKPTPSPAPAPPSPGPPAPPPAPIIPAPKGAKNVLLVMFDDYRAIHEVYGHVQPHVPHADGLANKSLIFDRAFCQQAVCGAVFRSAL